MVATDLASAVKLTVELGRAYDQSEEQPGLLIIRDVAAVQAIVRELASADLSPDVVLPALSGLTLTFQDHEGLWLGSVEVLTPRWLRQWWTRDALLPEPLSLLRDDDSDLHHHLRGGRDAADAVTPTYAAALDPAGVQHALGDRGTLCGLPASSVEVYRHTFGYGPADCRDCYRVAWADNDIPRWPVVYPHAEALSSSWSHRWGSTPPIGYVLRGNADTWVRFHSLPESKRYADTPDEYRELLHRHYTVLGELASTNGATEVLVLTHSRSMSALPMPQSAALQTALSASQYWASFQDPDDPEDPAWHHTFVNRVPRNPAALDSLLRLVADDEIRGVVICDIDLEWAYHPYDGGADAFPATLTQRDALRDEHADWLSAHPQGL